MINGPFTQWDPNLRYVSLYMSFYNFIDLVNRIIEEKFQWNLDKMHHFPYWKFDLKMPSEETWTFYLGLRMLRPVHHLLLEISTHLIINVHYNDVIMNVMASQFPAARLFIQAFVQAHIKANIKAQVHWPLCGNTPVTGEYPTQRTSNAENISVWWRQHVNRIYIGSTGPRWAPCWPHHLCYLGRSYSSSCK